MAAHWRQFGEAVVSIAECKEKAEESLVRLGFEGGRSTIHYVSSGRPGFVATFICYDDREPVAHVAYMEDAGGKGEATASAYLRALASAHSGDQPEHVDDSYLPPSTPEVRAACADTGKRHQAIIINMIVGKMAALGILAAARRG
jgi:hypothetical protein